MQNIEYKAELRDLDAARVQCKVIDAHYIGILEQTDTYYRLSDGRLKRRVAPGEPTFWIYYHRPDRVSPRMSNYTILSDEQARARWGTQSLKEWLVVKKKRELWMLQNVRIHLDEVEGLGTFLEFEAIVGKRFDVKACHRAIDRLRGTFEPILGEAISGSYSDMVALENESK